MVTRSSRRDTVSWADAGMKRSKHYSGLPPQ